MFHRHFWRGRKGFTFAYGTRYSNPKRMQVTQKGCHRRYAKRLESCYGCATRGAIEMVHEVGQECPECRRCAIYSCSCAKTSSTRRCSAWVSSPLGKFEAFVSLRSGACHPRTQAEDLMVTEPEGSATLNIPDRTSCIEFTRSYVAAVLSV